MNNIEMKNIEKYKETKDALEAWRQSREGGVYLSFDEWAQREYEAPRAPTLLEAEKEAAFNRLVVPTLEQWTGIERNGSEIADLKRENALLRAALKPVLECKVLSAMTAEIGPCESDYCSNIIFKAQRIYNEGGESEVKE